MGRCGGCSRRNLVGHGRCVLKGALGDPFIEELGSVPSVEMQPGDVFG